MCPDPGNELSFLLDQVKCVIQDQSVCCSSNCIYTYSDADIEIFVSNILEEHCRWKSHCGVFFSCGKCIYA